ncbi:hypothetical protein Pst134EB_002072 [Puccinia striiformis f. sp. tritici]|nr:hypothetical protein Pst134EB_002072 [Puccinia striiformis f. sp. tritici]
MLVVRPTDGAEDGIGGISDNHSRLALSFALWNENDPILKERLFGVTGHQEFEILETDAFDDNKYWDVYVEYAKDEENESGISVRIAAYTRGPDPATHI